MKNPYLNQSIFGICVTLLFASSSCFAGIYKWVDANGETHYSEKKEDAEKAKVSELKIKPAPMQPQATDNSLLRNLQGQERQFKKLQEQNMQGSAARPPILPPPSLSGGRSDGTDSSRCNLARDVLSGAVSHRNGAATDDYDRKVAENDIRTFCH